MISSESYADWRVGAVKVKISQILLRTLSNVPFHNVGKNVRWMRVCLPVVDGSSLSEEKKFETCNSVVTSVCDGMYVELLNQSIGIRRAI